MWLFFQQQTDLFNGRTKRVLHVAPERCFQPLLRKKLGNNYVTADLFNPRADIKMDITDIKLDDESIDVIYCSHVLEHVNDDRKAMREFQRILKKNGWAILLVPIFPGLTFEDPAIVDPKERLRHYGQEDHVRRYGSDYVDRLVEAGFIVKVWTVNELFEKDDIEKMGLTPASGEIYVCTKNQ